MDNNWSINQTKKLFAYVVEAAENNRGLVWAFSRMSEESGRSVNSVRNYYYSQLKMFELVPSLAADLGIELKAGKRGEFDLFSENEIKELIETVLTQKAEGKSVRAIIAELSKGDGKTALRLQNKYRSMITHHKQRVAAVMNDMSARGIIYFNPYNKSIVTKDNASNYQKLSEYISSLDESEVDSFFVLMKKLFA